MTYHLSPDIMTLRTRGPIHLSMSQHVASIANVLSQDDLNENSSARHEKPCELLVRGVPRFQISMGFCCCASCLTAKEIKTILLTTTHTSGTGLGGIDLDLKGKPPP